MDIEKLLNILRLSNKLSAIERQAKISEVNRYENNAEHSYQVALVAWYVTEQLNIEVDKGKLFEYAIAHDIEEIHVGDLDPFISSDEKLTQKEQREIEAASKIKEEFPEFTSLHKTLADYKNREDKEAQIVYVVDKILHTLNTDLSKDDYYFKHHVTKEMELEWFRDKTLKTSVANNELKSLVDTICDFIQNHKTLYPE